MVTIDKPDELGIPVGNGTLRVLRFGTGPRLVLAVHGITGSAMAFRAIARQLPVEYSLFAPDLRGRGGSAGLPGPYGLDRHASDVLRAAELLGRAGRLTLLGHSMGAYVALRAAAARSALFDRLLLVDGGLPLPTPPGADPERVLDSMLGPMLARLDRTFDSAAAYVDLFRAHPALGPYWNADIEAYVRADLTGPDGALRSRVSADAVRADGRDLLTSTARVEADLERLRLPALLVYAPRGLFDREPGLLPVGVVARWRERSPSLRTELLPGCNHYTIVLGERARLVAQRLTEPLGDSPS
ncbi:alpha/beta fold hydrolase [Streptantibioticus rubrisoli]|uniref:Alpha/beta hydrolase n=1 Tax=Streptantibioticus rubrisoli TaxID=1387313 RepID=A0ABT1P8L0_9ACTN|nr:alpha/beta hydrolase [Streptantibioticus rubrisoli]MCQ4041146.1 alpha/beta hydrolase [Streptantibioticus rubrisoli]